MRKIIFTSILFLTIFISSGYAASSPPSVYVLCYHTFLGKPKIFTDFSLQEFRDQIQSLKSHNFNFISLSDLKTNKIKGNRNVMLMIDDGNITAYRAYQNILKPMNLRPVFAIYPGVIDHANYAMTWAQLRTLLSDGCEIAAHGFYHEYLNEKFAQTHKKEFKNEIVLSKEILESQLTIKIDSFVYPFGVESESAKKLIKATGYRYAFGLTAKPLSFPISDAFDLPRYMLTRSTARMTFKTIMETP